MFPDLTACSQSQMRVLHDDRMNRHLKLLAAFLLCGLSSLLWAIEPLPVMVGGDNEFDACASLGRTMQETVVRDGPDSKHNRVDVLPAGLDVWLCSESDDWVGIVFSHRDRTLCGVSSPLGARTPYVGPCHSGWIPGASVTVVAG